MEETFTNGRPVRATIPTAPGRGKPHGAAGRTCSHPGCSTVLSVYNASPTCWTHQDGTGTARAERFSRTVPRRSVGHAIPPAA
jgi:hypothetical protein